jgi:CBS domain-containing protein
VPGFPLDGGRVLRAILWAATHSLRRATHWAANVGRAVAVLMVVYAVYLLYQGDVVSGVWMGAIAWFLFNAASASVQQVDMEARFGQVRVRDVVHASDATVPPGISVADLVERYMLPLNLRAVPVTDNSRLVGIVSVSDVMRVPFERRAETAVAEIMGGREGVLTVEADSGVLAAIDVLSEHDLEQLPVVDHGRLVGLLTRTDVMRQLQLREALNA